MEEDCDCEGWADGEFRGSIEMAVEWDDSGEVWTCGRDDGQSKVPRHLKHRTQVLAALERPEGKGDGEGYLSFVNDIMNVCEFSKFSSRFPKDLLHVYSALHVGMSHVRYVSGPSFPCYLIHAENVLPLPIRSNSHLQTQGIEAKHHHNETPLDLVSLLQN